MRSMLSGAVLLSLGLSSMVGPLSLELFEMIPDLIFEERLGSNSFMDLSNGRADLLSHLTFSLGRRLALHLSQTRTITPFLAYFAEAPVFTMNPHGKFPD